MRTILNLCCIVTLGLATMLAGGCGSDPGDSTAVSVTAGTTQVADLARQVAGERADVTQILPANADPHDYEPKPSDAESLVDADLIVKSGGDLDLWLDQLIEGSGSNAPVLTLINTVDVLPGEGGEDDPHWWQDPSNAIVAVDVIRDQLVGIDPEGAGAYRANAAAYVAKLKQLDSSIAACVERVPAEERRLVTSHDALGYYADRYGIEVIGAAIPALTTQAQPSAGETADLVDTIRATGVTTIFAEAGVSQELEQTIAAEAGAAVGGELWADTLGPEGSDGETYIESQESNTAKLVDGFTGGEQSCEIDVG